VGLQFSRDIFFFVHGDALKKAIKRSKIDINSVGGGGQTPLMASCLGGSAKTAEWLIKNGADVTIGEKDGYTCFHGVGFQGRPKVTKVLFEQGLKDDMHTDGYFGFHRACWGNEKRHAKTVQQFLKNGVDPELKTQRGQTCMSMTRNKHTKRVLNKWIKKRKSQNQC